MRGPDYYIPDVPNTMYFYGSYGLHGAYWHDNFGHPMSHGCVNMRLSDAAALFGWASVGTKVVIR
jgi:lipoprotein-anchoring transpeptidase ErfK/SrfK